MICTRCQREIGEKEHYIEVKEWNNEKMLKQNFMHKNCWDELMTARATATRAMNMANQLMNKMGFKQEEVIEIK